MSFVDGQKVISFGQGVHSRASAAYDVETGEVRANNVPRVASNRIPYHTWEPKIFYTHPSDLTKMRYNSSQDPLNNLVDRKTALQSFLISNVGVSGASTWEKVSLGTSSGSSPRPIDAYRVGPFDRKHFVILCGVHGNEIDGVEGAFKAFELLATEPEFQAFRDEWSIFFIPALNPDGWFAGTRNLEVLGTLTPRTINLNRQFDWFWDEYVETEFESKGDTANSTNEARAILDYYEGVGAFSGQGPITFGFLMDLHANKGVGKRYQSRDRIWREITSPPGVVPGDGVLPTSYLATYIDVYTWRAASAMTGLRARTAEGPDYAIAYFRSRFRPHLHAYFSSKGVPSIAIEELKVADAGGRETYASAADFRMDYILSAAAMATSDWWEFEDAVLIERGGRNLLKNAHFEQWQALDERPGNYTISRAEIGRNPHVPEISPDTTKHFDDSGEAIELTSRTDIVLPNASEYVRSANVAPAIGSSLAGRFVVVSPQMAGIFLYDFDTAYAADFAGTPDLTLGHTELYGTGLAFAVENAADIIGGGTAAPSTGAVTTISRVANLSAAVPTESVGIGALNFTRMFHAVTDNFLALPNSGDQRAFIFGGYNAAGNRQDSAEIWNPSTTTSGNSANTLPQVAAAAGTEFVADATAVYHPPTDRVYIFGGTDNVNTTARDTIVQYNVGADTFAVHATAMDVALKHVAASYSPRDGRIWIFGGEDAAGAMSNKIYSFDPATGAYVEEDVTQNLDDDEDQHDTEDGSGGDSDAGSWATPIGRWSAITLLESTGDADGVMYIAGGRLTNTVGALQEELYSFDPADEIISLARLSDYGYVRYSVPVAEREYEAGASSTEGTMAIKVTGVSGRSYINSSLTFTGSGVTGEFLELTQNPGGDTLLRVKELDGIPAVGDVITADSSSEDLHATVASVPADDFATVDETNQWSDPSNVWVVDAGHAASDQTVDTEGPLILRNGIDWENNLITMEVEKSGGTPPDFAVVTRGTFSGSTLTDGYRVVYDDSTNTWTIRRVVASAETVLATNDVTATATSQITTSARVLQVRIEDRDPVTITVIFNGATIFSDVLDIATTRIRDVGDIAIQAGDASGDHYRIDVFRLRSALWKRGSFAASMFVKSGQALTSGYVRQTIQTKDESAPLSADQETFVRRIRNYYSIAHSSRYAWYRNRVDFRAGKSFNREDGFRHYLRLYKTGQTVFTDGPCVVEGSLMPQSFIHPLEDLASETMTFPSAVALDSFNFSFSWMPTFGFCDIGESDMEICRVHGDANNYISVVLVAGNQYEREYNLDDVLGPHNPGIKVRKVLAGSEVATATVQGCYYGYVVGEPSVEATEDYLRIQVIHQVGGGLGLRVERSRRVGEAFSVADLTSMGITGLSEIRYNGAGWYGPPKLLHQDSFGRPADKGSPRRKFFIKRADTFRRSFGRTVTASLGGEQDPTGGQRVFDMPFIETETFDRGDDANLGDDWSIIRQTGNGWNIESNQASCEEAGFEYWSRRRPKHADAIIQATVAINNTSDLVGVFQRLDLDGVSARNEVFGYGAEVLETGASAASLRIVLFWNDQKTVLGTQALSSYATGVPVVLVFTTSGTTLTAQTLPVGSDTVTATLSLTDTVIRKPGQVGIYGETGAAGQKVTVDDWSLQPNFVSTVD